VLKNYSQVIFYSCLGFSACRYNIDTHDYDVRLRAAQRFLKDGDKVSNTLTFHSHYLGANLQSEPYNQVA
jgi:translation initiation factor IF-3